MVGGEMSLIRSRGAGIARGKLRKGYFNISVLMRYLSPPPLLQG